MENEGRRRAKKEGQKARKGKLGRKDKQGAGRRDEVLLRTEQHCQGTKKERGKDKQKHKEVRGRHLHRS